MKLDQKVLVEKSYAKFFSGTLLCLEVEGFQFQFQIQLISEWILVVIYAKVKLGELSFKYDNNAKVEIKDKQIFISKGGESPLYSRMWGTVRSRINNIVQGVSEGSLKNLNWLESVIKQHLKAKTLELLLGYSHPILFEVPDDLKVEVPKPTQIKISGIDKQKVGQIAANKVI